MNDLSPIFSSPLSSDALETTGRSARKVSQDFESILLHMLLKEMEGTIQTSGLFDDSATRQAKGMFWTFLAQEIAEAGGLGLARDIERAIEDSSLPQESDGEVVP